MALELARAFVSIVPSMQGVQGEINKSFGAGSPLDKQAVDAGKRTGGLLSKGVGGALAAVGPYAGIAAAGLGIAALTGYVTDSVKAVANWQALNAQSASAVKATGGAANVSAQQVNALAQSLEGQTSTQAETIQQGANLLLTFRGIRNEAGKGNDVFNQTTAASVDMARALGTDVPSAAMMLGKALNDPAAGMTRLTRSGVTFTEEQKNQVKALQASGDTMGAQKVILAELNKEFGGSGAAYAKTYGGQLYQLQDAVGDFGEEIATAAMPALTALVGTASKVVAWAGGLDLGAKAASGIGTVFTAIGPPIQAALAALGPVLPAVLQLATAFSPLQIAVQALVPVLPVLALALAQVGAALGQGLAQAVLALAPGLTSVVNASVAFLVPLLQMPGVLQTIVVALVAWRTVATGLAVVQAIMAGIGAATSAAAAETVAAGLASRVYGIATTAMSAATKAAAIGQWLLNAAMTANPIGVVVVAVAALVAGLVWFFTQTKVGQQIVAGAMQGIAVAFKWVQTAAGAVVGWIGKNWPMLLGIITGPIGAAVAFVVTHWAQIRQITVAAFSAIVSAVRTAIGNAVAVLTTFPAKAIAVFARVSALLVGVGANIVAGLVRGIQNSAGAVITAARNLANLLPEWARKVLGIASPSKVFTQIGRFVGQGLVKGLAGSQDQVKTAATSLMNQVTDAFTKLADQREAAQKRLAKLDKQLAGTDTSTKSGKASAAKLRDQIREQQGVLADIKAAPKGAKRKSLLADLKDDTKQLTALAGRRDQLADQLKTAQSKLADAVKVRDDFAAQVKATTIGLGSVTDAYASVVDARKTASDSIADLQGKLGDLADSQSTASSDADSTRAKLAIVDQQMASLAGYGTDYSSKLADLQNTRIDLASTLADQLGKVADYTAQTAATQAKLNQAQVDSTQSAGPKILANLRDAITQTQTFQTLLGQLKSFGVDDTTYSQILEKGVDGGGIGAAQELVQGGPQLVQQVAGLQGQLATAGQALGVQTSTVLYQAGVTAAQGSVDGIKAKIVDNQAAIALLQVAMAQSISSLGINTAPLMKGAGAQIVAGLTDGIKGKKSDLQAVIDDLGKTAVKRLKKVLGIKSPSRVFRNQVGAMIPLGIAAGVEDTRATAEDAVANLAGVPDVAAFRPSIAEAGLPTGGGMTQIFNGPMGYSRDEIIDQWTTRGRRMLAGVNIPKVRVG